MLSSERHSLRSCTAELQHHLSDQTEGEVMNESISCGKYLILLRKIHHVGKLRSAHLKFVKWLKKKKKKLVLALSSWKASWIYMLNFVWSPVLQITECKTRNVCNDDLFYGERKKWHCSLTSLCLSCKEPSVYTTHMQTAIYCMCTLCFNHRCFLQILKISSQCSLQC